MFIQPTQVATQLGRAAEELASRLYQKAGFEIMAQNYRYGHYEIDLIAKRGNYVHMVEVKFRRSLKDANLALSQAQFQRIATAGEYFMRDYPHFMQIDTLFLVTCSILGHFIMTDKMAED